MSSATFWNIFGYIFTSDLFWSNAEQRLCCQINELDKNNLKSGTTHVI